MGETGSMPLIIAPIGEKCTIKRVSGNRDLRRHLADIGLAEGAEITVLSNSCGNIIAEVKNIRFALDRKLASGISV